MEKRYEVYKIVNNKNGKIYVGITNQGYKKRWYKHCSESIHDSTFPIHQALRKYGFDAFTVSVVESCEDVETLKEREKYWIKELNTRTTNKLGYNLTDGGDGTFGRKCSKKTRDKLRQKAKNRIYSDSTKQRMSINSSRIKVISQFTLDGELIKTFRSVTEAAKTVSSNKTNIAKCARGETKTSGGYKWSYTNEVVTDSLIIIPTKVKEKLPKQPMSEETKSKIRETNKKRWDDDPERRKRASLNNHKNKVILQFDLENNFIREFRNVSEAVKSVNASTHTNIAKCARGERKTSCGYIWKYKE